MAVTISDTVSQIDDNLYDYGEEAQLPDLPMDPKSDQKSDLPMDFDDFKDDDKKR